jgi:hypothetical protein
MSVWVLHVGADFQQVLGRKNTQGIDQGCLRGMSRGTTRAHTRRFARQGRGQGSHARPYGYGACGAWWPSTASVRALVRALLLLPATLCPWRTCCAHKQRLTNRSHREEVVATARGERPVSRPWDHEPTPGSWRSPVGIGGFANAGVRRGKVAAGACQEVRGRQQLREPDSQPDQAVSGHRRGYPPETVPPAALRWLFVHRLCAFR